MCAPTDGAFAALPDGTVEALLADIPTLSDILPYHVVPGNLDASMVTSSSLLTTLNGSKIKVEMRDGAAFIGGSQIIVTDIPASNGTIHVLDAVAMPPESIASIAAADENFSTLVTALGAANLVDTLAGDGPFTVFAPTNAAFEALPAGTLDALLADTAALSEILLYHVVVGDDLNAASVLERSLIASGASIDFKVLRSSSPTSRRATASFTSSIDGANIVATDIPARNGVIHVIDSVIVPPTN